MQMQVYLVYQNDAFAKQRVADRIGQREAMGQVAYQREIYFLAVR